MKLPAFYAVATFGGIDGLVIEGALFITFVVAFAAWIQWRKKHGLD